jgi:hypothetical protein
VDFQAVCRDFRSPLEVYLKPEISSLPPENEQKSRGFGGISGVHWRFT